MEELNSPDLPLAIKKAWEQFLLQDQGSPNKRPYVYASAFRECDRRMTLEMVEGDKLPLFQPDTLANFRRGRDRERDLIADLTRIGRICDPPFEVIGREQRFELQDHKQRVAIVGKVDARLKFSRNVEAPLEIKSWNQNLTAKIRCFEDLFDNKWTKGGAYQLLAYLVGSGERQGFMLLDRAGIPLLLPVDLYSNLDRIESFLLKAEKAMDHKEASTLPDFIQDAGECKICPFYGSVCQPPIFSGNGASVLIDPELIQHLERREELKTAADEYDDLDKDLKSKLRGVEQAVAGPFLIQGKWGKQTLYEVPLQIKDQYRRIVENGRFTLTIEKVG